MPNQVLLGKLGLGNVSKIGADLNISSLVTDYWLHENFPGKLEKGCSRLALNFINAFYVLVQIYCGN